MSLYKSFVGAAKAYLESIPFLKFLLTARIYVFSLGGLIFLLGSFIGGVYDLFTCIGSIILWAGLLLMLISEDAPALVIAGGSLSAISLIAWVVGLIANPWAGFYGYVVFRWQPFLYFLIFGAIAIIIFVKSEKFKQLRAQAAARAAMPCPRCGAGIPKGAGFCSNCGAPNPAMSYPPPSYAPPAGPYPPPYPPYPPTYSAVPADAPAPPPYTPPTPPPSVPPVDSAAPAVKQCSGCGAEIPAEAVFCGKCGAKQ
jgi:ribosomal protein L40E